METETVKLPERLDDSCIQGNTRNSTTLANKIGDVIASNIPFARDKAQNLYYFANGVYHAGGEFYIEQLYKVWLRQNGDMDSWRDNMGGKVAKWVMTDPRCKVLWDRPPLGTINLLNGLYDWDQGVFNPHSPNYLSTVQIPVVYDANAECPTWDKFLTDILPIKGGPQYLQQIMALCLTPFMGVQKCIVLVGEGSNGKSTFLSALQRFVGENNVSNVPLHVLTNPLERFSRAGIVGKLVNIFGDLSKQKIEDVSNFKALVGEDRLLIENKHKDAYYYTPFCKLIFSCNEMVKSDDNSVGYKRRFVNIPFTQKFVGDPKIGLELADKLSSQNEMSGILNRVLPWIHTITSEGMTTTPEIASVIDDWCIIPDSIRGWIESVVCPDENGLIHVEGFYGCYCEMAPADDLPREHSKLVKYMKHIFGTQTQPVKIEGKTVMCYVGVRTKSREMGDVWLYPAKEWE